MHCAIYSSKALIDFDDESLDQLAFNAATRNAAVGITGYLFFLEGHFTQYIEGRREAVANLIKKLNKDSRHEISIVLDNDQLSVRRFPSWSMKCFNENDLAHIRLENVLATHLQFLTRGSQVDSLANLYLKLGADPRFH